MASGYRGITVGAGGGKEGWPAPVAHRHDEPPARKVAPDPAARPLPPDTAGGGRKATRTIRDEQDLPSPGSSPRVPQSGLEGIPLAPEDEKARHKSPDSPFPSEHGHEVLKLADEGLTQAEIAERVGLSRSYVGRIIRASKEGE